MKQLLIAAVCLIWLSCQSRLKPDTAINQLAENYVRLGLQIGAYDPAFVDAYYGPDSLKPKYPTAAVLPKDSLLHAANLQQQEIDSLLKTGLADSSQQRLHWISAQLTAFHRRIRMIAGEKSSFDEESKDLFGVTAPVFPESHYQTLVQQLNQLLPGKGLLSERFQQLSNHFIIPKEKLDTVFKAAIAECRKRTRSHYTLPGKEDFRMEFVTGKPWNGYNWYKGQYQSLIQINTDLPVLIDRAIDVGSHESYPGHHVYNMLLEQNLYRGKGWVEISLYPLFSPQSLIAEGSANYGIELAFPGEEKVKFSKEVLLPLAGLDTTGIEAYYEAVSLRAQLNYARNEAARGLLNGTMSETEAIRWLVDYALFTPGSAAKSLDFIRQYRSYVINYNFGMDLVRHYVETPGSTQADHWKKFGQLLSNPVRSSDLLPAEKGR
jgi:hypothetical protein